MINESKQLNSSVVFPPRNPCETCGFWSTMCDQSKCAMFKQYKEEIKKFNNCK